ncbi:MAG TPA: hypothetical protein VFZ85_07970 [Jiangellaceae bacterium]
MRASLVVPVVLVAVVVACSEQEMPSSGPGVGTPATADAGDLSPLEEYLGEGAVSFEGGFGVSMYGMSLDEPYRPSDELLRQQRETEELIAECMREEGFEYVPLTDMYVPPQPDDAWALPEDEFTATYGYGISTILPDVDRPKDPNEAIREAMSQAEYEAYRIALHGDQANAWSGETPPPLSESGCAGKATAEVYGNLDEYGRDPLWEALTSDLSALDMRIDDDPRVVEAERAWINCMADAGYPTIDHIGGGQTLVANRMDEVLGIEGSEALLPWSEADPEAVRELQQFEIAVASADRACKIEHFDDVFREVRFQLEAEFVEEHRDELERHRTRLAEGD